MGRQHARALGTMNVAALTDDGLEALNLDVVSYAPAPATSNASGFG